jgi:hypothetical protein
MQQAQTAESGQAPSPRNKIFCCCSCMTYLNDFSRGECCWVGGWENNTSLKPRTMNLWRNSAYDKGHTITQCSSTDQHIDTQHSRHDTPYKTIISKKGKNHHRKYLPNKLWWKKNALRKDATYRFRPLSWPYRPYSVLNKSYNKATTGV